MTPLRWRSGPRCARSSATRLDRALPARPSFNQVTSIQPELWVESPRKALSFYAAAFGARVLHQVGEADDIVAPLTAGVATFWVASTSEAMRRFSVINVALNKALIRPTIIPVDAEGSDL